MASEEKTKKAPAKKASAKKEVKKTSTKSTSTKKKTTPTTKSANAVVKTTAKTPVKKSSTKTIVQEENHYGRTLLAALLIVLVFIGGYVGIQYKKNNLTPDSKYVATADEKKFKEEYESLNGTTRTNGQKNRDVEIMVDNNVKYINIKEAAEILENGSGVIYFGFAACPWCRNAVPVLLNAMNASELDTIYYVNIKPEDDPEQDIRDTYVLDTKNKARKSRDAEAAYFDVLRALANDLDDYVLYTDKGKPVNTGEKRLAAPTVVSVKDGVVVGFHQGTVEGHDRVDGVLEDLTKEQETELLNTYSKVISKYLNSDCDNDSEKGC